MTIPFVTEFDFEYGRCDRLSPLIRRAFGCFGSPSRTGFTEPGNFTHAFKRWSGQTPRDYQRSKRAADHQ